MKRHLYIARLLCLLALTWAACGRVAARQAPTESQLTDSVELSLVTCAPHEEVYSLYGHTALRYHNLKTGEDIVFNYGIFDFKKPHFVLRFIFGLTDYELGIAPTPSFCEYYRRWGSMVTEQVLNLTQEEKSRICGALAINLLPQNRVYRYNYFYDNCSTRPRDIIEQNIAGSVVYQPRDDYNPSYREMIRTMTRNHPWVTYGNDMLLGVKADRKATQREQEFLPEHLMYDFDRAQIETDGHRRPLVKERRILVAAGVQTIEQDFPFSPMACAIALLTLSLLLLAIEQWRGVTFWQWDCILMLLQGLAGCVLFVMLFSQHPTTSANLQMLLLHPLALFFLVGICRKKPSTRYFHLQTALTALFFIGSLWQDYAEGMEIVALCLLTRCWRNLSPRHEK